MARPLALDFRSCDARTPQPGGLAPGNWVSAYGFIANFKPGHQETWVNDKNASRAPLLFIGGGEDHIMPPSANKSNAKHYNGNTVTEYHEFPGRSHWTCGEPGWEAVADHAGVGGSTRDGTTGRVRALKPA